MKKQKNKRINPFQFQYKMGFEAGLTEPNETNCNFRLFSSSEATKEWGRGNRAGLREKEMKKQIQTEKRYWGIFLENFPKRKRVGKNKVKK